VPSTEALVNAIGHFLACIGNDESPRSDATAGVRTVRLLEAAEQSLEKSGALTPVEIAVMSA
jgi:hypothetical protein